MKPSEIKDIVMKIKEEIEKDDTQDNKIKLMEKYKEFSDNYPIIFLSTINNNLDINKFTGMVKMAEDVSNKKISQHDASVKVGESLVNEYVKPKIYKK